MNNVHLVTQEKKQVKTDRKWAKCTECTAQGQHARLGRAPSAQAARLPLPCCARPARPARRWLPSARLPPTRPAAPPRARPRACRARVCRLRAQHHNTSKSQHTECVTTHLGSSPVLLLLHQKFIYFSLFMINIFFFINSSSMKNH